MQKAINQIPTYIVDSFTTQKFKGNPAGVCLLDAPIAEQQMLNIANELGFSETAFVIQEPDGDGSCYRIRFFSPAQEIDLCGHATLASAKILFHTGRVAGVIKFKNINNLELIVKQDDASDALLMAFPAYYTQPVNTADVSASLLPALGLTHNQVVEYAYSKDIHKLIVQIDSCDALAKLAVDIDKLRTAADVDGVVITAKSNKPEFDFESRLFAPWIGIDEDPVTGAIHTFLTTYWADKLSKTRMNALQCSPRSGSMMVELTKNNTVILKGDAQIVLEGVLTL